MCCPLESVGGFIILIEHVTETSEKRLRSSHVGRQFTCHGDLVEGFGKSIEAVEGITMVEANDRIIGNSVNDRCVIPFCHIETPGSHRNFSGAHGDIDRCIPARDHLLIARQRTIKVASCGESLSLLDQWSLSYCGARHGHHLQADP